MTQKIPPAVLARFFAYLDWYSACPFARDLEACAETNS